MTPAEVTEMTSEQPDAASSSATSTANGAPTAQATMPIWRPSTAVSQSSVW
jgi:hypothetical protein